MYVETIAENSERGAGVCFGCGAGKVAKVTPLSLGGGRGCSPSITSPYFILIEQPHALIVAAGRVGEEISVTQQQSRP
jgi:hypothetical protein